MQREDIQAIVLHSDLARTGWFDSSSALLNQFHQNVVWSMRGNFLGVPTDCPQRAERLGWTGDIQVFAPTACFLYDVAGLLSSWLRDLTCDQTDQGGVVPVVVPNVVEKFGANAGWGDAATVVPWVLYQRYGDKRILERQYGSMRAWVEVLADLAGEHFLWDHGFQFGDWLDPSAPQNNPAAAKTDPYLLATAYFAHSTDILARTAALLGKTEEAAHYNELVQHIRSAFSREYVTPAGRLMSDAATAYCLALSFNLLSTVKQRVNAVKQLARIVRENDYHISTGFIGTPLVCDTLCEHGYCEEAYKLLMQTSIPSWLYPVTRGATTIWERWDAIRPDGSIPKSGMLSFNHYALGAVADWLHHTVAGLAPGKPGYRKIRFHPMPGPGLTHASARHKTPYGMAEAGWRIEKDQIHYQLTVPPNTSADVHLREAHFEVIQVGSGEHTWVYTCNM
jgi:alpha-L-rhamnosidase